MAAAPFSTPVKLLSPLNRSRPDCRRKTGVFIATWRSSTHFRHRHLLRWTRGTGRPRRRSSCLSGSCSSPGRPLPRVPGDRNVWFGICSADDGGRGERGPADQGPIRRRGLRHPALRRPAPGRAYGSRLLPQPGLGSGMVGPSSSPGRPGPLGLRPHRAQRRANFCAAGSTPGRWYSLQSERRSLWGSGTAFPMNRERHGEYRRRREFVAVVWDRAVGGARGFAPG